MNGLDGKGRAETAGSVETTGSASNELNGLYSEVGACADDTILNTRDFVRGTADSTCADAKGASGADATGADATGADATGADATGADAADATTGAATGASGPATLNTRGLTGASTGSSTTDSRTLALGSVVGGNPDNSSKNSGCSFCSVIQSNRIKLNHADEFSGTIY